MKTYGLIGYPLSHSFSGTYFAEKFLREGITDAEYKLFPIENINLLSSLIADLNNLAGLNVTIPYKQQVIPFLNECDDAVREIGAANTIKIERFEGQTRLKGYNTDVYGFAESLKPLLAPGQKSGKALILGTGGAARAVEWVLKRMDFNVIYVSRNPSKTGQISYSEVDEDLIRQALLIVNSSPSGMHPRIEECPDIPYRYITRDHILYDLVYNPGLTLFLKKGAGQGAKIKNGLEMLHLQAAKSWEIWTKPK